MRRVHAVTGALFTGGLIGLIAAAVLMLLYLGRIEECPSCFEGKDL